MTDILRRSWLTPWELFSTLSAVSSACAVVWPRVVGGPPPPSLNTPLMPGGYWLSLGLANGLRGQDSHRHDDDKHEEKLHRDPEKNFESFAKSSSAN